MSALIIGRVNTGAGGSGIYLGSLQYLAGITKAKERGFYMSLIGMFRGVGAVLGSVIGGAFFHVHSNLALVFYTNLVIGAAVWVSFSLGLRNGCAPFPVICHAVRTQVLLYMVASAGTTTLYVVVYYIPIYFRLVNDDNGLMAAVHLLLLVIIGVTASLASETSSTSSSSTRLSTS
ncbi:hypothetical protein MPDQ_002158 [Monascus purpureus]|uniref:Major facilitator superfamily (MFS) profile domain-containing protein n=1 Tax=Monascus purpureus TaxID=5098 RepID=A0A507QNM5_MONPU|nr:hypothetical protein MPDQ_002158 [Monascus purpureus]